MTLFAMSITDIAKEDIMLTTRNVRLAAIRTFIRFIEYREPSALAQVQRIRAIPTKRADTRLVDYLSRDEMQALLDAPAPDTRDGVRDRAMLHVAYSAGLRVSELVGLRLENLAFDPRLSIRVLGKGRRRRALPLWRETPAALRAWLALRPTRQAPEVFLNARGAAMTRSGFEYILDKHVHTAAQRGPSLLTKNVSPHCLRHYVSFLTMSDNPEAPADLTGNVASSRAQVLPITQHSFARIQESNCRVS
jgi:integrase/recombinase XerD